MNKKQSTMKFGTKVIIALALWQTCGLFPLVITGRSVNSGWMKFIRTPVLCRIGEYRR